MQFYFVVSGLKIIGHGNPDNNLESPCMLRVTKGMNGIINDYLQNDVL
jgi:hypothetical protein